MTRSCKASACASVVALQLVRVPFAGITRQRAGRAQCRRQRCECRSMKALNSSSSSSSSSCSSSSF
eukprot:5966241-Pyramimonas_sp.AAC.1